MRPGRLTTFQVRRLKAPGRYSDGGNLYLHIKPGGARTWPLRFQLPGRQPWEMGLGVEADVTLAEARDRARNARRLLDEARDPIEARKLARQAAGHGITLREVAAFYVAAYQDT